jgi:tetratricopeptide (TPR) repeat protein
MAKTQSSPRVFINYRREDTLGPAGALASTLRQSLEVGEVFFDHGGIQPGQAWPDRLRDEMQRATVVLVLIGKAWLNVSLSDGIRRLDEPEDWVRAEIAEALAADDKVIIPVLVDGALTPRPEAFRTEPSKSIEKLIERQAVEFSSGAWDESVDRIWRHLESHGFRRVPRREKHRPTRAIRSTVPVRGAAVLHGRDDLLADLARLIDTGSTLIALHGAQGVGKSELAREFARRNDARFPGGQFVVDMRASGPPVDLARLGWTVLGLEFPPNMPLDVQCHQTLLSLAEECLLIYDNAQSPQQVQEWLPTHGVLANVIVTTTLDEWDQRWRRVFVAPLSDVYARRIVDDLGGSLITSEVAARLVEQAHGLPAQLVPATLSARKAVALGGSLEVLNQSRSFDHPWSVLDTEARLLLVACTWFHPDRISRAVLESVFANTMHWRKRRTDASISIVKDQGLLDGADPLRMHQLLNRFVCQHKDDLERDWVRILGEEFAALFVNTSRSVTLNPASSEHTLTLLSFSPDVDVWSGTIRAAADVHGVGFSLSQIGRFEEAIPWLRHAADLGLNPPDGEAADYTQAGRSLHEAGFCLYRLGRHEEAQQCFEGALQSLERGGPDGQIDHTYRARSLHEIGHSLSARERYEDARVWYEQSVEAARRAPANKVDNETISASLHQVGVCLKQLDRPDQALEWFERAEEAALLGDEHGRVDYESLGRTLGQKADCLWQAGRPDDAIVVAKRAVEEKKRGDVHGRINHVSVGRSLHQIGYILTRQARHEDALIWYEQAAEVTESGDQYGRADHQSIGRTMHQIGVSLVALGSSGDAKMYFERALEEKLRGDTLGRIDDASVELTRKKLAEFA